MNSTFFIFFTMQSPAFNHFPRYVFDGDQKWLFNPILKKRYANLPEERIRLQWLEFAIHQMGWKKSRIGFELPVHFKSKEAKLRADLVLYDRELNPQVLIECKAPGVPLNEKAAEQAARYNSVIKARYVVLTSGEKEIWFSMDDGLAEKTAIPFPVTEPGQELRDENYWCKRGFCSASSPQPVLARVKEFLCFMQKKRDEWPVQYLDFKTSFLPVSMSHYYHIIRVDSTRKIALGLIGSTQTDSFLVAVLNRRQKNEGILTLNLDSLFRKEMNPGTLQIGPAVRSIDAGRLSGEFFGVSDSPPFEKFIYSVTHFFD